MKLFKNVIKAIISIGLMAYLVHQAEPQKILEVFSQISATNGFLFLILAVVLILASILLMAIRWQILLNGYNTSFQLSRLFSYYLIGLFFNNFLPTSIGGDVIRIYKVVNDTDDRTVGFASVIIERMMGIAATLFMAIVALFFISRQFHSSRLLYMSIALFIMISLFFFIMTRNRPFKLLLRFFDKFTFFSIGEKFNKLFEAIHYFKNRRRVFLYVFLLSLLSQIFIVFMNFLITRAFSIQVDLSYLFMVVPATILLTMLPSINGVGVRDLGFVSLLGRVGVSDAAAISISTMNVLIPMLVSVAGAFLFATQKKKIKFGEIDAVKSSF